MSDAGHLTKGYQELMTPYSAARVSEARLHRFHDPIQVIRFSPVKRGGVDLNQGTDLESRRPPIVQNVKALEIFARDGLFVTAISFGDAVQ